MQKIKLFSVTLLTLAIFLSQFTCSYVEIEHVDHPSGVPMVPVSIGSPKQSKLAIFDTASFYTSFSCSDNDLGHFTFNIENSDTAELVGCNDTICGCTNEQCFYQCRLRSDFEIKTRGYYEYPIEDNRFSASRIRYDMQFGETVAAIKPSLYQDLSNFMPSRPKTRALRMLRDEETEVGNFNGQNDDDECNDDTHCKDNEENDDEENDDEENDDEENDDEENDDEENDDEENDDEENDDEENDDEENDDEENDDEENDNEENDDEESAIDKFFDSFFDYMKHYIKDKISGFNFEDEATKSEFFDAFFPSFFFEAGQHIREMKQHFSTESFNESMKDYFLDSFCSTMENYFDTSKEMFVRMMNDASQYDHFSNSFCYDMEQFFKNDDTNKFNYEEQNDEEQNDEEQNDEEQNDEEQNDEEQNDEEQNDEEQNDEEQNGEEQNGEEESAIDKFFDSFFNYMKHYIKDKISGFNFEDEATKSEFFDAFFSSFFYETRQHIRKMKQHFSTEPFNESMKDYFFDSFCSTMEKYFDTKKEMFVRMMNDASQYDHFSNSFCYDMEQFFKNDETHKFNDNKQNDDEGYDDEGYDDEGYDDEENDDEENDDEQNDDEQNDDEQNDEEESAIDKFFDSFFGYMKQYTKNKISGFNFEDEATKSEFFDAFFSSFFYETRQHIRKMKQHFSTEPFNESMKDYFFDSFCSTMEKYFDTKKEMFVRMMNDASQYDHFSNSFCYDLEQFFKIGETSKFSDNKQIYDEENDDEENDDEENDDEQNDDEQNDEEESAIDKFFDSFFGYMKQYTKDKISGFNFEDEATKSEFFDAFFSSFFYETRQHIREMKQHFSTKPFNESMKDQFLASFCSTMEKYFDTKKEMFGSMMNDASQYDHFSNSFCYDMEQFFKNDDTHKFNDNEQNDDEGNDEEQNDDEENDEEESAIDKFFDSFFGYMKQYTKDKISGFNFEDEATKSKFFDAFFSSFFYETRQHIRKMKQHFSTEPFNESMKDQFLDSFCSTMEKYFDTKKEMFVRMMNDASQYDHFSNSFCYDMEQFFKINEEEEIEKDETKEDDNETSLDMFFESFISDLKQFIADELSGFNLTDKEESEFYVQFIKPFLSKVYQFFQKIIPGKSWGSYKDDNFEDVDYCYEILQFFETRMPSFKSYKAEQFCRHLEQFVDNRINTFTSSDFYTNLVNNSKMSADKLTNAINDCVFNDSTYCNFTLQPQNETAPFGEEGPSKSELVKFLKNIWETYLPQSVYEKLYKCTFNDDVACTFDRDDFPKGYDFPFNCTYADKFFDCSKMAVLFEASNIWGNELHGYQDQGFCFSREIDDQVGAGYFFSDRISLANAELTQAVMVCKDEGNKPGVIGASRRHPRGDLFKNENTLNTTLVSSFVGICSGVEGSGGLISFGGYNKNYLTSKSINWGPLLDSNHYRFQVYVIRIPRMNYNYLERIEFIYDSGSTISFLPGFITNIYNDLIWKSCDVDNIHCKTNGIWIEIHHKDPIYMLNGTDFTLEGSDGVLIHVDPQHMLRKIEDGKWMTTYSTFSHDDTRVFTIGSPLTRNKYVLLDNEKQRIAFPEAHCNNCNKRSSSSSDNHSWIKFVIIAAIVVVAIALTFLIYHRFRSLRYTKIGNNNTTFSTKYTTV